MPRRAKAKGLYQRGHYWLDWDRRADGTLRSPNLAIFWYDPARGRVRSTSSHSADVDEARVALDRHFLTHTEGEAICPTCGQRRHAPHGFAVVRAIADYLASNAHLTSIVAVRARLAHVLRYIAHLSEPELQCERIDEEWIRRFRAWLVAQPVVSTAGNARAEPRSPSAVENSVLQLAAAINAAHRRGDTQRPARFRPIPMREVNRTPQRRLSVAELAQAMRYCVEAPDAKTPAMATRLKRERQALHRFLMAAIGTLGRPDAIHDISFDPKRGQWNSDRRVLALSPRGRRQTRKYRATVIVPWQLARQFDAASDGFWVPVASVRSAWRAMAAELGWPADGESGMKIIRRSVAQLLRDPARGVPSEQLELQLGHRRLDSVTDLYAAFDPAYLSAMTAALTALIDEIEATCPGAFFSLAGDGDTLVTLRSRPTV